MLATGAGAADAPGCKAVRIADLGWTDIAPNTAAAIVILKAPG